MDFFSSLNQVRKNSGQLDRWEQQQRDKDAQRKAYQAKHAPTPEELERAKELGETLINVIDIMDDHSESVAENVETATAGISTITMLAGGGATGYMAWNLGVKAEKRLDAAREAFNNDEKTKALLEKLNKNTEIRKPNGEIKKGSFEAHHLRGKKQRLEAITDSKLQAEALEMNKAWKKTRNSIIRNTKLAWIAMPVVGLVSWFLGNVYETKLQVDSSRIARFQARRELKDPKSFVNYTPEQIAEAKAELEKHPEKLKKKRKDKLKKGMFTSIRELLRDSENYKRTKKLRDEQQSLVQRPLTDAEILQAKKDQEVIQRTIKHINNEAEKYSEQMETTASVIMNTFPVVGGAIGLGLQLGLQKTGLIKKWVGNFVEKNGSEEAKTSWKAFKDLNHKDPKYKSAWEEFYYKLTGIPQNNTQRKDFWKNESIEKGIEELEKGNKRKIAIKKAKKILAGKMAHNSKAKWYFGIASSLLAAFPSALIALKLQKDASRAGRFTAKRELEKDPTNFIGYADSELDEVKDVKNTEKRESKFKEYALFIPRVMKNWWAYKQYRKNEFQDKQALQAELKKLDVSDKQLRNAKNLQTKVFNTFDKVDDKSQAYSEATEAAIETMQPLVYGAGALAMASPLIYFVIQVGRGKYTPAKITEKITNVFATSTGVLKSKLFKKYLGGVEKNVAHVVNNTDTDSTKYGELLKDINILETPVADMVIRGFRNKQLSIAQNLAKMKDWEQNSAIHKYISKATKQFEEKMISYEDLYKLEKAANNALEEEFKDADTYALKSKKIKIDYAIWQTVHGSDTKTIDADILKEAHRLIGEDNLKMLELHHQNKRTVHFLSDIYDKLTKITDTQMKADVISIATLNKPAIEAMSPEQFNKAKNFLVDEFLTKERADSVSEFIKMLSELKTGFMPKGETLEELIGKPEVIKTLDEMPKVKEAFEQALQKVQNFDIPQRSGDELIDLLKNSTGKEEVLKFFDKLPDLTKIINGQTLPFRLKDTPEYIEKIATVAKGVKAASDLSDKTFKTSLGDSRIIKLMSNADIITNPKVGLEKLSKAIKDMDDQTYIKFVTRTPFGGWEKESVVNIISNISKVWENIPKEESKRIMSAMIKQFNENPDKFIEAFKTGKIMKMFATPQIQNALKIAGISWTVFTAVMTYAIESWLAEIQLRAGRLGVKSAMDELQDHRYYANVIPDEQHVEPSQTKTQEIQPTNNDLLAKFKK